MVANVVIMDPPGKQTGHAGAPPHDSYHEETLKLYLRQLMRQEICVSHQAHL